jgi:hypothetical protein
LEAELNLDLDSNPAQNPELITDPDPNLQIISDPDPDAQHCRRVNILKFSKLMLLRILEVTLPGNC